jgi:hypothetical protein
VQFNVSTVLSTALDERAQADDLVLGEVIMDAVRAYKLQVSPLLHHSLGLNPTSTPPAIIRGR